MCLVPRDPSDAEWMFPSSVHERTRYELIKATYQFSFLLLFVLFTGRPHFRLLVGYILFNHARNRRTNTLQSLCVVCGKVQIGKEGGGGLF